jgi:hypothetical protein
MATKKGYSKATLIVKKLKTEVIINGMNKIISISLIFSFNLPFSKLIGLTM